MDEFACSFNKIITEIIYFDRMPINIKNNLVYFVINNNQFEENYKKNFEKIKFLKFFSFKYYNRFNSC